MLTKRHVNRPIFTKKKKKKNPAKIGKCYQNKELPWCLSGKESACTSGDVGSVPGWGTSPGEGKSNPLQCSCLGHPMGRGAWQTAGHNKTIKKSRQSKNIKKNTHWLAPNVMTQVPQGSLSAIRGFPFS